MIIKIATSYILEEKVKSILVLKDEIHTQDKWMIGLK